MLKFYYNPAPNPMKVALALEEFGLPYEPVPVDTRKGEQHTPAYLALNPNGKVPVIVDDGVTVFDSNAILLYLADKHGKFLPEDGPGSRAHLYSWMMFVASGVGPYSGQSVHFRHSAPERIDYATNRYLFEAKRHYGILDQRLADNEFILGKTYTVVDMAAWGWARMAAHVIGEDNVAPMKNLRRLIDGISSRPAAQRAIALKDRHTFKTDNDDVALRAMFPSNYANAG